MHQQSQCVAEISLYPLQSEYVAVIKAFIDNLAAYPEFTMNVTTTSTQIMGPYSLLFRVLGEEIARVHEQVGQTVLVCKFLMGKDMRLGGHSAHQYEGSNN